MENDEFIGTPIDGKAMATYITEQLKEIIEKDKLAPYKDGKFNTESMLPSKMKLIIVTTGDSAAGASYVTSKITKCNELGIMAIIIHYDFLSSDAVNNLCTRLSKYDYPPFIIQLPIIGDNTRMEIYEKLFTNMKANGSFEFDDDIRKHIAMMDVDGIISPDNILYTYAPTHMIDMDLHSLISYHNLPCTPIGIMYMLDKTLGKDLSGLSATILGRSELVSKPLYQYLMDRDCTVTMCHSKTNKYDITEYIKNSDIIISAMGKLNELSDAINILTDKAKENLNLDKKVLIDVSINRGSDGKLHGDCDIETAKKFKYYTPVPGGVGPMTVAMLMCNVVKYYQNTYQSNYAGSIIPVYPMKMNPKSIDIYRYTMI